MGSGSIYNRTGYRFVTFEVVDNFAIGSLAALDGHHEGDVVQFDRITGLRNIDGMTDRRQISTGKADGFRLFIFDIEA